MFFFVVNCSLVFNIYLYLIKWLIDFLIFIRFFWVVIFWFLKGNEKIDIVRIVKVGIFLVLDSYLESWGNLVIIIILVFRLVGSWI